MNPIDKIVSFFNPVSGLKRTYARKTIGALTNMSDNGYLVPGSRRKGMKGFTARLDSPAKDIDRKLKGIRAASRDMSMNSSLASSIFRRYRVNVPGSGLQVQPRVDREFLGLSDEEADAWNKAAIREFDLWSNSLEGDYTGIATPNELQSLIYLSSLINGDVLFALPWIESKSKNWPYRTAVKVIDADLVRDPDEESLRLNKSTNAKIRNGVEYDSKGRLAAYWVANFYSNDDYNEKAKFERIPIFDDNGERQIFHFLDHERIEQRRGIPMLAPVIESLKNISRLSESELMSALVASFFSVFIKDQSGMGGTLQEGFIPPQETEGGGGGEGPEAPQEPKTPGNEFDLQMGYGNMTYLDDDKDITIAETRNKKDFEPFFKASATLVSAAVDLPYEVVLLTYQRSYSAMRGAINEAYKKYRVERFRLSTRVNQPWYEAIITEAVIRNRIQAPKFFDDPIYKKAWCRAVWIGAGQGHIDPMKEANASSVLVRNAMSTREEEYTKKTGDRWDPMVDRLAREESKMTDLDLIVNPDDNQALTDSRRETEDE